MEIDSTNSGSATVWPTGWNDIIAFRPTGATTWTPIKTTKVVSVNKAFLPAAQTSYYKYATRCNIKITLQDDSSIFFDAQDVSNQATWNDGTEGELDNAVDDLASWI